METTYEVYIKEIREGIIQVNAHNEEEAAIKANELMDEGDLTDVSEDVCSDYKITKIEPW